MAENSNYSDKINDIPNFVAVCLTSFIVTVFIFCCALRISIPMATEPQYGYVLPFSLFCGLFLAYALDKK